MITNEVRRELDALYKERHPNGDERDGREFVATVEFQFEVERRNLQSKLAKIKSILEAAQKKAAQQPHMANHFAYRENVYRMAIEAVMKELQ